MIYFHVHKDIKHSLGASTLHKRLTRNLLRARHGRLIYFVYACKRATAVREHQPWLRSHSRGLQLKLFPLSAALCVRPFSTLGAREPTRSRSGKQRRDVRRFLLHISAGAEMKRGGGRTVDTRPATQRLHTRSSRTLKGDSNKP